MLSLLGLIVAAAPFGMTPAMELATDMLHYYEMNGAIVSDLRYYSENTEHCETEQPYFRFNHGTQKVDCEDVQSYFKGQYLAVTNLAYKVSGQCQELYSTSNVGICQKRVERDMTQLTQ